MESTIEYKEVFSYLDSHDCASEVCSLDLYKTFIVEKKYCNSIIQSAANNLYEESIEAVVDPARSKVILYPDLKILHKKVIEFMYANKANLLDESEYEGLYELTIQDKLLNLLALVDDSLAIKIITSSIKSVLNLKESEVIFEDDQFYVKEFVYPIDRRKVGRGLKTTSYEEFFEEELKHVSLDEIVEEVIEAPVTELTKDFGFVDHSKYYKHFDRYSVRYIANELITSYNKTDKYDAVEIATSIVSDEKFKTMIMSVVTEILFKDIGANHSDPNNRVGEQFLKWYDGSTFFDFTAPLDKQRLQKPGIVINDEIMPVYSVVQIIKKSQSKLNRVKSLKKEILYLKDGVEDTSKKIEELKNKAELVNVKILKKKVIIKSAQQRLRDAKTCYKEKGNFKFKNEEKDLKTIHHKDLPKYISLREKYISDLQSDVSNLQKEKTALLSEVERSLKSKKKNLLKNIKEHEESIVLIKSDVSSHIDKYEEYAKAVGEALITKPKAIKFK